jgi:alpha-1,6-mannosyltransferase
MILHVALQPWYVLWAVIPLAASAGTSRFRVAATLISAGLPFLLPPTGSTFDGRSYVLPYAYIAAVVVVALAVLVVNRVAPLLLTRPKHLPEHLAPS